MKIKIKNLCLTYDNLDMCDGSGAQLQRIAFIFGLAIEYGYSHLRTGIYRIDSNPGDGLKSEKEKQSIVFQLNQLFVEPLGDCGHTHHSTITPRFTLLITRFKLYRIWLSLNNLVNLKKNNPLLKINSRLISKNASPKFYILYANLIKNNKKFIKWAQTKAVSEIQVHFQAAKTSQSRMTERYIDPDKLKKIIVECKKFNSEWKVTLHTDLELNSKSWKIVGSQCEQTMIYWRKEGFLDNEGNAKLNSIDLNRTFPSNLVDHIVTGISPLETWKLMTNAKILICGKSSFSFIGALLNVKPNSIIIVPRGYIKYPSNWVKIDYKSNEINFKIQRKFLKSLRL